MNKLRVSKTKDYFMKDGKGWFYLADTLWTAFSNVTLDEWEEYLEYRRIQGFNAIQMNVLYQWDSGKPKLGISPYTVNSDGSCDISKFNEEYFNRAQAMLEIAVNKGFTPVLVVLWCTLVPDTWATKDKAESVLPYELVKPYTEYVVKTFSKFNPIYVISGDTDFGSEKTDLYYITALETIKSLDPDALTTMHLNPDVDPPDVYINSKHLDFYMYQSGHRLHEQHFSYKLAQDFYRKPVKRPIVNGEPCYEGHTYGGVYGRFKEFDIRKAIWQSLLSGAKAGVTYGAHGVWGWYTEGVGFQNESFGGKPLPWRKALAYEGAWEGSFAKWVFEKFDLFDLEPRDIILNQTGEIRISVSGDSSKVAVYIPYNEDVMIDMDLTGYDFTLFELSGKHYAKPRIIVHDGISTIKMHDFNSSDVLVIGMKQA